MPREKENMRVILADILEFTDNKRRLTATDVGNYLGVTRQTAKKLYDLDKRGITAPELARRLALK